MSHPSWEELSGYVDNALDTHRWAAVARHVRDCRECADAIADLTAVNRALERTLDQDPGDAYFANFAAGVEARIEVEARNRAPGGLTRGWARWWETPGGLSLAGAAAAVVVAAGVIFMMGRGPTNVLHDAGALEHSEQVAPPAPIEAPPVDAQHPGEPIPEAPSGAPLVAPPAPASGGPRNEEVRAHEVRPNAIGDDERTKERDALGGASPLEARESAARQKSMSAPSPTKALAAPAPMAARRDAAGTEVRLCGEVHDASGRPLRFANVALPGRNLMATTDDHGRFCLFGAPGTDSLIVTMVGFRTVRRGIALRHDMPDQVIAMDAVSAVNYVSPSVASVPTMAARELAKTEPQSTTLAALPDTVQKMADLAVRMSGAAARSSDVRQHEAAAAQWQKLLKHVEGTPLENETRGHIAEDRYRAWELEPNSKRQQAAREALTAFLVRAPAGPERNRATLWLDKVAK